MEEQVGAFWHKLISRAADTSYPQAEVRLADMQKHLGLYFRALGGDPGLQLEIAERSAINRRRSWLQRMAGSGDKIDATGINERALKLPPSISVFAQKNLNRALYYWLTALAARQAYIRDPRLNQWINRNQLATLLTLQSYPGLEKTYRQLVDAHLRQRPQVSALPAAERACEEAIRSALLQPGTIMRLPESPRAPFPIPLWLYDDHIAAPVKDSASDDENTHRQNPDSEVHELDEISRRRAERVKMPEKNRGLVTIRMENIFTWGEFVNADRGDEEEEDKDRAEAVARDLEKLAVARDAQAGKMRLKFDLDLPSSAEDDQIINDGILLPEWDWKQAALQPNHCHVVEMLPEDHPQQDLPEHLRATARKLKNQFQRLTPARIWLRNQIDGQEIDLESYLRFQAERQAGLAVNGEHFYRDLKRGKRDMACLLLADLSLSTDTWVSDHQRVIDVIRDSLWLFAESLDAVGDPFSILGFSSRKRDPIRLHLLKRFEEPYNGAIRGRIGQIKPGFYTRLGAAVRYATRQLGVQPATQRLLLILTDGKPNDLDQYEGRYGIEDTRQAILEARQQGLQPFCVTIDRKGSQYLPHLFGNKGFVVIRNPLHMPKCLPKLYLQLTQ